MGLFGVADVMGGGEEGQKGPHFLKSVIHILQKLNLAQLYLT